MLHPGDLLSHRYRLERFLASGGMGEVWRATDVVLGRAVAVKVLLPAVLTEPRFASRFRAEARILAGFHHPNVVDVYDFGETPIDGGTVAYLVMAYVDGESLSQRIASAGRLPVAETLSVVAQAADALHAAHANGVVHRDVKPGNLLERADGTVVLVDFGVARSAAVPAITNANAVPGTAPYMAPEQVSGQRVSGATDVYALGAVAYHCLAGRPPFTGDAAVEVALRHVNDEPPPLPADIPEPVRALVERALAKDPADRYPTAAAFAAAARALMPGAAVAGPMTAPVGRAAVPAPAYPGPVTAPDPVPEPAAFGPSHRRAAIVVSATAGLLIAAGVAMVLAFSTGRGEPPARVDRSASPAVSVPASVSPTGRARATRTAQPAKPAATPAATPTAPPHSPSPSAKPVDSTPPPVSPPAPPPPPPSGAPSGAQIAAPTTPPASPRPGSPALASPAFDTAG